MKKVELTSTLDQDTQMAYFYASEKKDRPFVVSLHTWSGNYEQKDGLAIQCIEKDYNYIHPDFRGPNYIFKACGSRYVIQDIEDAISFAIKNGNVDIKNIHVIGVSGGGYATLLIYMNTKHPVRSFSVWVPIYDLKKWYYQSEGRDSKYAYDIARATVPDAYGINDKGKRVRVTEYGFNTDVVSIFHKGYRETVHTFIKNMAKGIDTKKILYFEMTVEPQYMGQINICYSTHAKNEYEKWRAVNNITEKDSEFPDAFPVPEPFVFNETWNKFRAQFLAKWINEDAGAYREIAGEKTYVSVDFLDAEESTTIRRNGDPIEFLRHLTSPDIIQVNWSWYFPENSPNQKAYDRVYQAMAETNRDWVVTEHMTFNGNDFVRYDEETLRKILLYSLKQGTRFGWEFVNLGNSSQSNFSLYEDDWSPKRVMNVVDGNWDYWMEQVKSIEENSK